MKKITLLSFFLVSTAFGGFTQQILLEGQASVLNSGYKTGKIEYVSNASVTASKAAPAVTDALGKFGLEFVLVDSGSTVAVLVSKSGMEVVNAHELEEVVVGREAMLRVFMAKPSELHQAQADLYAISIKALLARRDDIVAKLRGEIETSRATMLELQEQLNFEFAHRYAAEDYLNAQLEALKARLPERIAAMASVNLDFASELYRKAYALYESGKPEQAIVVLDGRILEKEYNDAMQQLGLISANLDGYDSVAVAVEEQLIQIIASYRLKAEAYNLRFDYRKAVSVSEKALRTMKLLKNGAVDLQLANLHGELGGYYWNLGDYDSALVHVEEDLKIKAGLLSWSDPDLAMAYSNVAIVLIDRGKYQEALVMQEKALEIAMRGMDVKDQRLANIYGNMAIIYSQLGNYEKAQTEQENAIGIWTLVDGDESEELAIAYNNLAWIMGRRGNYAAALATQQKTIEIQAIVLDSIHPNNAKSYSNLANIYLHLGKPSLALESQLLAIGIQKQILEATHPSLAISYNNLAMIYKEIGRFADAVNSQRKAISIFEKVLPKNHPDWALAWANLATIYSAEGKFDSALVAQNVGIASLEGMVELDKPRLAASLSVLAMIYRGLGQYDLAVETQQRAIGIQQEALEPDPPQMAAYYNGLGVIYKDAGEFSLALDYVLLAKEIMYTLKEPNVPEFCSYWNNLAAIYVGLGKYGDALDAQMAAIGLMEKVHDKMDPSLAIYYNNLVEILVSMEKFDEAILNQLKTIELQKESFGKSHAELIRSYSNLAMVYLTNLDTISALRAQKMAIEIVEERGIASLGIQAQAYGNLATIYKCKGHLDSALVAQKMVVSIQKTAVDETGIDPRDSNQFQGKLLELNEEPFEALNGNEKSIEIQKRMKNPTQLSLAYSLSDLAQLHRALGNYKEAIESEQASIDILVPILGRDHFSLANGLEHLAWIFRDAGDMSGALGAERGAIEILVKWNKQESLASAYHNLAALCFEVGHRDEAFEAQLKAIAMQETMLDKLDPALGTSYFNLGGYYYVDGQLDSAIAYKKRAYDIWKQNIAFESWQLKNLRTEIVSYCRRSGDQYRQQGLYKEALAVYAIAMNIESENSKLWMSVGLGHYGLAEYEEAIVAFEEALELEPALEAMWVAHLGMAHAKLRKYRKAEAYFERLRVLEPSEPSTYFTFALYFALKGNCNKALEYLSSAIDLGFDAWEWIESGEEFIELRAMPGYKKIIENK